MTQTLSVPTARPARTAPLVGSFMFAHFTHHVSNSLLAPLLPQIRAGFDLNYAQVGLLISAFSLSQGLSQAPIGVLADRVGSRIVIVVGLLATAATMVLIGLSGSYWLLLVLLVGLGVVAGTYHAPAAALIARSIPSQRLGAALGMHTVGGNLSFFATPLVAGGLTATSALGWRAPYLAFAIAPLLAGVFLALFAPGGRERDAHLAERAGLFRDLRGVLRVVGPLLSLAVLFQMMYAATVSFLAVFLVDVHELEPPAAAALVSVPFIGGLFGSPLGGFLSDRLGRKPVILLSLVCLGPLLLLFALAPLGAVIPLLVLMGLTASLRMPVVEGWLLDRAAPERRATTLGAYYFVAQEVGGIGAPALGLLSEAVGIGQAVAVVAAAAAALSLLILLVHPRL